MMLTEQLDKLTKDWLEAEANGQGEELPEHEVLAHCAGLIREALKEHKKRVAELMDDVQLAQDAAYGDSNDTEIELLRGALESAVELLGETMPDADEED